MTDLLRLVNTDQLKAEIAEALPISEVAEKLCDVELLSAGHQRKGCCPIHDEDTPSFYVNDTRGLAHCFGCKWGGDAIGLVREVHHVGFYEALALMAGAAGIDVAAYERPPTDEEREKDQLREWCEGWLGGLKLAAGRVPEALAREFGVVVPRKPKEMAQGFVERDYLLRGTVLFPYRNATGRLTGWKVRHEDKKMFGMPEGFPLLEPTFFGLQVAREHIERDGTLIVVEGEYDCLALHAAGLRNVVGLGGSTVSDEQMQLLVSLRLRDVVFWFDGDEGGRSGAESVAKRYWNYPDLRVRVGLAPAGADPEDFLNATGSEIVAAQLARVPDALEWLLRQEFERIPRSTMGEKLDFVRWVEREYGSKLNGLAQAVVLHDVAHWLGVPEADVLDLVKADRSLLQVIDSEKVVLGKAVREQKYFVDVRKRIGKDDFYMLRHRRLWDALTGMLADGLAFDGTIIKRRAQDQGVDPEYVELLIETGDLNIGWHEDQVIEYAIRRGAQADADRFRELIADVSVPANQLIGTLTHQVTSKALGRGSGAFRGIQEQVDDAMQKIHERQKDPDAVIGISLGSQFPRLTQTLQGLQRRRFMLVAATSGKGKSTATIQWCAGMAIAQAIPTDFISLEMDDDEILYKICAHLTDIDSQKVAAGALTPDEMKRVERAMLKIRKSPLRIYAPDGITPSEFVLYAREAVMDRRTEVFVVDYAQMVGADPDMRRQNRYEQLGDFAYTSKLKVARGLDTTVIAVAQLKRDAAEKDQPTPEDMGDSYELVRAADVILLLAQPDEDSAMEMWVGKNRQGPGNVLIPSGFRKPENTFHELGAPKIPDYAVV